MRRFPITVDPPAVPALGALGPRGSGRRALSPRVLSPRVLSPRALSPRALSLSVLCLGVLSLGSLTGCSSSSGATAGPTFVTASAGPSAGPAADDAALSKDTEAICAQASRTATSFGKTFVTDLSARSAAKSQGAQAKAAAEQQLTRDVQSYSGALASMAKLADDAKLKKALRQMSKEVTKLTGDLSKISPTTVSKMTANLDKACGKG
jgi:hypothetical protein